MVTSSTIPTMEQGVPATVEQSSSPDVINHQQSSPTDSNFSSKPTGQQTDTTDLDNELRSGFNLSTRTKLHSLIDDQIKGVANIVDQLLWRRVLDTRLKLMQDYIISKERLRTNDQQASYDLDADIDKHCESHLPMSAVHRKG